MALTFDRCRSCGGRTQIDTRLPPEDRRCVVCGGPCSESEAMDATEIPAADTGGSLESHRPAELVVAHCPHCDAGIALDPDKPLNKQWCPACGMLLEEAREKSRMRKRSRVTPDGLLIKRSRERIWMPIAGIMLAVVLASIFTLWMMHRPDTRAAPPEEELPPDDGMAITELVEKFTAARSPEDLLPLIREPDKFEKPLRAWCAAHPGALPPGGEMLDILPSREAYGITLRQVAVRFRELPAGLLVVARTPAGWKVDWRAFDPLADLSVEDFVSQKPASPVLVMAVVRRSDYYNGVYADKSVWESLHVSDRDGDHGFYAYVPRKSAALMESLLVLPPGGRQGDLRPAAASRRLTLRLQFKSPESAALKQAEVTGIEGDGWYLP